jgi:hypothetical protein
MRLRTKVVAVIDDHGRLDQEYTMPLGCADAAVLDGVF